MNFNCIICSDILQPSLEIYATSCGHIFHHVCLIQWLERSKTCPQCRCKVTEKTIHRLYFNLTNTDGIADDVATLQSKMDSLQFQMRLKDKDVQNYREKYQKAKEQSTALRSEVRTLEGKQVTFESVIHALKEQVTYFKSKNKDAEKLGDEIKRLKSKLQCLENIELIISGSTEQVRDMLRYNKEPEALNLFVCTLKKELVESERKYRHQNMTMKHLQTDLSAFKKQVDELTKWNSKLKNSMNCHRNCEDEKQYYKRKLSELEAKVSSRASLGASPNTSVKRIVAESPAPLCNAHKKALVNQEEGDTSLSPSAEASSEATDSASFSLSIKSSNVGLSCLLTPKFVTSKPKLPQRSASEYNLFKNSEATYKNFKLPKSDYNYDGLGGHSRDTKFPEPKPIAGVKRHKPVSANANKLRKLAPNKKLTDYLDKKTDDALLFIDE